MELEVVVKGSTPYLKSIASARRYLVHGQIFPRQRFGDGRQQVHRMMELGKISVGKLCVVPTLVTLLGCGRQAYVEG